VVLSLLALPGAAQAGGYPGGGSTFSGGAEGWTAIEGKCDILGTTEIGALCKAEGGYDAEHGNPAGSLAARTTATVNALGAFKSSVVLQSPEFTVSQGGQATLSLDRQLEVATLATVGPKATYKVNLLDRTNGNEVNVSGETLTENETTFVGRNGTVGVLAGHSYVLRIPVEIESTVKATLVGASGALRFDNVSLAVGTVNGGGNGGNGSGSGGNGNGANGNGGANGLTDARLQSLIASSLSGPATLKGNRLTVKAKCPKKIGVACRTTVQGMMKKGKPATAPHTAKIAKGKGKQLVLRVKPAAKDKLAGRKKLLFKVTVKAGKAKATVYKTLKLIHRR
jgi:hypothetical protein